MTIQSLLFNFLLYSTPLLSNLFQKVSVLCYNKEHMRSAVYSFKEQQQQTKVFTAKKEKGVYHNG